MYKNLNFGNDARMQIKNGVDKLAEAVKVTIGPKGYNVIIERENELPHITKDGVTVAKSINFNDKLENIGAQLVKEVAIKTAKEAGDGTSTSTILAQIIYEKGLNAINDKKLNPIFLKRSLEKYTSDVIKLIKEESIEINGNYDRIKNVATISANNDHEIGNIIADAIKMATEYGMVLVEETNSINTSLHKVEGIQIDKGMASPFFITDSVKMIAELDNPYVLLVANKITKVKDLFPAMEVAASESRPIVIIADDYDEDVLGNLVTNNMRGSISICAIKSPGFGQYKLKLMEDLALLTKSVLISDSHGIKLKDFNKSWLGTCEKFQSNNEGSLLIGCPCSQEEIDSQLTKIQMILSTLEDHISTQAYREFTEDRLTRLGGNIVIIKVGATSEIEMREKRDRIDDALCATKSAIEEGIVTGGGSMYLRVADKLSNMITDNKYDEAAIGILISALCYPFRVLCENSGIDFKTISFSKNEGMNFLTEKIEDLYEAGVIDPTKVERCAFENAINISSLFLTTNCVISF